jgi:hypothetical protein
MLADCQQMSINSHSNLTHELKFVDDYKKLFDPTITFSNLSIIFSQISSSSTCSSSIILDDLIKIIASYTFLNLDEINF